MKKNLNFSSFFVFLFLAFFLGFFGFCFVQSGKILLKVQKFSLKEKGFQKLTINLNLIESFTTNLWLFVFTLISVVSLSILFAFFVYFFIFLKSEKVKNLQFWKNFYTNSINFFANIPEFLWAVIFFSFFHIFLKIQKESIFFLSVCLFISLFILITRSILIFFSLNKTELIDIYQKNTNIIEILLFRIIPKISLDLGGLIIKIFSFLSSLGMIFLTTNNIFSIKKEIRIPKSLSDDGETILSSIYILFFKMKNIKTFEEKILANIVIFIFFLLILELIFYLIKKFLNKNQK